MFFCNAGTELRMHACMHVCVCVESRMSAVNGALRAPHGTLLREEISGLRRGQEISGLHPRGSSGRKAAADVL